MKLNKVGDISIHNDYYSFLVPCDRLNKLAICQLLAYVNIVYRIVLYSV